MVLQLDTIGLNSVAASCGAANEWLAALALSVELRHIALMWSEVTCGILLSVCLGRWRRAVQYVSKAPSDWLTAATLGSAITTCSGGLAWREAWNLFSQEKLCCFSLAFAAWVWPFRCHKG